MLTKQNSRLLGVKARTSGNLPGLKESTYRMAFVFLLKLLKESFAKHHRLTNYLISYRFLKWKTGIESLNLAERFAGSSKGSLFLRILMKISPATSPGLMKEVPMQYVPAPPQRICQRPLLQASRIHI